MEKTTFVYFKLWNEYFAISVDKVIEVFELPEIVEVPATPDFVKGVTNFRGDIIPVIDMRKKFKLPADEQQEKQYIIVVNYVTEGYENKIGLVVDKIIDVINVVKYDINNFPELGSKYNPEFIFGIIKHNDRFILVLDIDKILDAAEVEILKDLKINNIEANNA